MKHIRHSIPHKLLEYIDLHFVRGKLANIKEEKKGGLKLFRVEVEEGGNIHHLEFSDKGGLVKDDAEVMFIRGRHEDFFREEGFYEKN